MNEKLNSTPQFFFILFFFVFFVLARKVCWGVFLVFGFGFFPPTVFIFVARYMAISPLLSLFHSLT